MIRSAIVLAALLVPGASFAAYVFAGGAFTFSNDFVSVPDIVGLSDTDADMALEAVGLDTGTDTPQCSDAAENVVVIQSPAAGSLVAPAALVDIWTSDGTACRSGGQGISIRIGIGL